MGAWCRIELFGDLRVVEGERTITRFRTGKTAALLAYLAFHRDHAHPRETLTEMLWPWASPAAGRQSLSQALSSLRHQLEPPGVPAGAVLVANRTHVQLNPQAVTTDLSEFEAALRAAERATDKVAKERELEEAVRLYRGELLSGLYEPWIPAEQVRLSEEFVAAVVHLAKLLAERGETAAAISHLRQAIETEPLQEKPYRELMRRLTEQGEHGAALKAFQELERVLSDELGERPSAAAQGLAREVERRAREQRGVATAAVSVGRPPMHRPGHAKLPTGTVTILLVRTDGGIGGEEAATTNSLHEEFRRHGGVEIEADPGALAVAFSQAGEALNCAATCQLRAFGKGTTDREPPARLTMALHTAELAVGPGRSYPPGSFQRAERLLGAAHPAQILCSEASAGLLRYDLNGGLHLRDLGVYRLRGAGASERIFQLDYRGSADAFPALNAELGHPSHLPLRLTRFFGRRQEVEKLREILAGDARLVTVIGPPGCGKTRLAIEVAAGLQETFHGAVWFVPLADLREGEILDRALDPLGIPRSPEMKPIEQIAAALGDEPALIVFDNFEHLIEKAGEVHALLERLPLLRCLVTSRRRLDLTGERQFPIGPLPMPEARASLADLLRNETVALFVDRAQAVKPDFQLTAANAPAVVEIGRHLEGVPLAIELAAARISGLTPARIAEKLGDPALLTTHARDAEERHRSLRAAVEWSYALLTPELQRLFARLSMFRGGWTVEAAAAVCEEPLASDCLAELVDCSLVALDREAQPEPRFRMLEMVREYAAEKVNALGDEGSLHDSHFHYFYGLVERVIKNADEPEERRLHLFDADHDNLLAALDWASHAPGQLQDAMTMASWLFRFWLWRGHIALGREILARLLGLDSERRPTFARGCALLAAGWLAYGQDAEAASSAFVEALEIARRLDATAIEARALHGLGIVASDQGNYALAKQRFTESGNLYERLGDHNSVMGIQLSLGVIAYDYGEYDSAWRAFSASLALVREHSGPEAGALPLANLGNVANKKKDYSLANSLYAEGLAIARREDKHEAAHILCCWGSSTHEQGDTALAVSRISEGLEMGRQMGDRGVIALGLLNLGHVHSRAGDIERSREHLVEFFELAPPVVPRVLVPSGFGYASVLAATWADRLSGPKALEISRHAVRLYAAGQGVRNSIGTPSQVEPWEPQHVRSLSDAVDAPAFEAAWAEGLAMTYDQAITYALDFLKALKPADLSLLKTP